MNNFLSGKKKIITMILGILSGLAIIFGVDQGEVSTIAGAIVSVVSVTGYLLAEGRIDVERIKNAAVDLNEALDVLDGIEPVVIKGFVADSEEDQAESQGN